MLRETDPAKAAGADARVRETDHRYRGAPVADDRGGTASLPMRSYVKGWKISPSHYLNQDLAEHLAGQIDVSRYVLKRVLLVIPTLIGAAALVFLLMRLIPGDICVVRLGSGGGHLRSERARGLPRRDRPRPADHRAVPRFRLGILPPRFRHLDVVGQAGDRRRSRRGCRSRSRSHCWPRSSPILIAIPLGTISALKQNSWIDVAVRVFAIGGIATPSFWIGIVSILLVLDLSNAIIGSPWMPPIDYVPIWQDPIAQPVDGGPAGASPSATVTPPSACA